MSNQIVIGSQQEVLNFHLNEKFLTVPKIIIPAKEFVSNISSQEEISPLFELLSTKQEKKEEKSSMQEAISNLSINEQFHKLVQEHIKSVSKDIDVHLKDYNFMSSVSNTRYTVTLRTPWSAYSKYFLEKGSIIHAMKQLLLEFALTETVSSSKSHNFQFECFESEEQYKSLFLKKEHNQLFLYGIFGTFPPGALNAVGGGEIYHSIEENFHFYANKQEFAYLRQHGVLEQREIHQQERVLTSEELKKINENTKHIDNVILQLYLTQKGTLKIEHVMPNDQELGVASKLGCVLVKSRKQYNKISLVNLNEVKEIETSNPLYLLIKNEYEFQEVLRDINNLPIDGIVATYNCYHPLLEEIAKVKDLDIIYYNESLQRSLEATINWEDFSIEGAKSSSKQANPFSSIISSENKEKDELLEKLKNVDLSTTAGSNNKEREEIENLTQSMTASPASSQKTSTNSSMMPNSNTGEKKSAIGMLAEAVLNENNSKAERESASQQEEISQNEATPQQESFTQQESFQQENFSQETPVESPAANLDGFFSDTHQQAPQQSQENVSCYDSVLATKLLTPPTVPNSQGHIVDSTSIQTVQSDGEIILVVSSESEISNTSLKHAMPVSQGVDTRAHMLISSAEEYFLALQEENYSGIIINLCTLDSSIKQKILEESVERFKLVSVIAYKDDVPLLESSINAVEYVFVKDCQSQEDFEEVKQLLLAFEKRFLLRN